MAPEQIWEGGVNFSGQVWQTSRRRQTANHASAGKARKAYSRPGNKIKHSGPIIAWKPTSIIIPQFSGQKNKILKIGIDNQFLIKTVWEVLGRPREGPGPIVESPGEIFVHHFGMYPPLVLDTVMTPGAYTSQKCFQMHKKRTKHIYSQNKFATAKKLQK